VKTTAIRLEDNLYAQLTVVAQLESQTITDAIRLAVIDYIEQRKSSLSNQADAALAEIEREAAIRRQAITALFGSNGATAPEVPVGADQPSATRARRGKDGGISTS
jgi:predicted transcriptional regulator